MYINFVNSPLQPFNQLAIFSLNREAVEIVIRLSSTTKHIGVLLSEQYAMEMAKSRRMLLNMIRFLARQVIPLRGHYDDNDGNCISY
jgi:hypothetical protein